MASKILSISIPQDLYQYLMEDDYLSASKIFQVALKNIIENRKLTDKGYEVLKNKYLNLQKKYFDAIQELEELKATKNVLQSKKTD